jgi:prefoldin alpha subunit
VSASAAPSEERVQEDLMRLEAYRNQLNTLLQQHQYLSASFGDHRRARETLEGLEGASPEGEFLIPVGGETYLRGSVDRGAAVLIGLGSGVVSEMPRPQASELLADRIAKIEEARKDLEVQMGELEARIEALSQRLESMTRGAARTDDVGGD